MQTVANGDVVFNSNIIHQLCDDGARCQEHRVVRLILQSRWSWHPHDGAACSTGASEVVFRRGEHGWKSSGVIWTHVRWLQTPQPWHSCVHARDFFAYCRWMCDLSLPLRLALMFLAAEWRDRSQLHTPEPSAAYVIKRIAQSPPAPTTGQTPCTHWPHGTWVWPVGGQWVGGTLSVSLNNALSILAAPAMCCIRDRIIHKAMGHQTVQNVKKHAPSPSAATANMHRLPNCTNF